MTPDVITTRNLTKHFSKVHAVNDLSLNIRKGEIFGFLGLNGAGKTTTIRMLLGMIKPTSGSQFLFGQRISPGKSKIWSRVGYMVEIPYAYPELTVRENLEITRRLRSISRNTTEDILRRLKLEEYGDRKVRNLSQGNSQRLGLAKALIHHPELLILDEPSNGLDPSGIVEIRELLTELAVNHGVTVFISSHILGEISRIATRIGIIHQGDLICEMDIAGLDMLLRRRLIVKTADFRTASGILSKSNHSILAKEDGILELSDKDAIGDPGKIATLLVQHGLPPSLLKVEEEDLESFFLRTIINKGKMS